MGRLWCRDLPTVRLTRQDRASRLTLVIPYYENPAFLQRQARGWNLLPQDIRDVLTVIVVDDGSPESPASDVLRDLYPGFRLRLFRIDVDVRWNWLAARNIGAHYADSDRLLLTDIDHVVPVETFRTAIYGEMDERMVYAFARTEHTGEPANPHSASFLMTRDLFWRIGGYDEALSGYYGTDGEYRRRAATVARFALLPDVLIRHEYVEDSSTTRYRRKQPEDAAAKKLVAARSKHWKPKTLSFPHHEALIGVCDMEYAR